MHLHLRFEWFQVRSGPDAANDVEPVKIRAVKHSHHTVNLWFAGKRKPESGRIIRESVAVKSGRCNTDDGVRESIDHEACADNRRVFSEFLLPGVEAHHDNGSSAFLIIRWAEEAACVSLDPKRIECVT